ncbi:hypothetical protein BAC1_01858 [uncultured bacterium]|nr:hypothetical protein BAC1_01858 [uncultured bacterium]
MSARLNDELRHAGVGILLGLLGVLFGVFWAVYITVNNDEIHMKLMRAEVSSIEEKFVLSPGAGEAGHDGHGAPADHSVHAPNAAADEPADHAMHDGHGEEAAADGGVELKSVELDKIKKELAQRSPAQEHHGSPEMAAAHERLAKAHVHAMGLGVLSIAISVLLAFMPASARAKTFAAACVGTGGLFYPLAWIVMGMRTTAMGTEAAASSVATMAGLSAFLIALGLVFTLAYAVKWLFSKNRRPRLI